MHFFTIREFVDRLYGYILIVSTLALLGPGFGVPAAEGSGLQTGDCGKCHGFQTRMVAAKGGKHASAVGCLDCHPQHPPKGEQTIAECVTCHKDQPHFQIGDCLQCHVDPHEPLESLRDPIKPARRECLSCHPEVGRQMASSGSRHAELFCNRCHGRHHQIPGCLECHEAHAPNQSEAECRRCHPAHQPLTIIPSGYFPREACRPCHKQQADDLAATATNHGGLACVYCHQGRHPATPACQKCHGLPHVQAIHVRHRSCLDCHGDAHRLISHR